MVRNYTCDSIKSLSKYDKVCVICVSKCCFLSLVLFVCGMFILQSMCVYSYSLINYYLLFIKSSFWFHQYSQVKLCKTLSNSLHDASETPYGCCCMSLYQLSHLATFHKLNFFLAYKVFFLQRPPTQKSYVGQVWPMLHALHTSNNSKLWRAGQVYSSDVVEVASCGLGGR